MLLQNLVVYCTLQSFITLFFESVYSYEADIGCSIVLFVKLRSIAAQQTAALAAARSYEQTSDEIAQWSWDYADAICYSRRYCIHIHCYSASGNYHLHVVFIRRLLLYFATTNIISASEKKYSICLRQIIRM